MKQCTYGEQMEERRGAQVGDEHCKLTLKQAQGSLAWKVKDSRYEGDELKDAQAEVPFLFLASYCPYQPHYS